MALFLEQTLYLHSFWHWVQEEKGTTDDERVGWHCQLNGHEFEQALGDGEGQWSLACCIPWDHKELDTTEWLNNSRKTLGLPFLKKNQPGDFPGFPVAKAVCFCVSTAGSQVWFLVRGTKILLALRQKKKKISLNEYPWQSKSTYFGVTKLLPYISLKVFQVAQYKESACQTGDSGSIPGSGRSPEDLNAFQYSCLGIPGTEEPGGLQSMGSQELNIA